MKVKESIFKSFFEKKNFETENSMSSFRAKGAQTLGVLTKAVPAWEVETLVISRWGEQWKGTGMEQLTCWKFKKTRRIPTLYTLLYCRASSTRGNVWSTADTKKDSERNAKANLKQWVPTHWHWRWVNLPRIPWKWLGSPSQTKPEVEEICHVRKIVSRKGCIYAFSWSGTSLLCWPGFWHIWLIWARSEYPNCQQW